MCYHINMIKHSIRYFNKKEVRAVWDNEQSMWWYSAVDFINILIEPNSPRRYWNNVKVRNPELSPFCGQLKLYADDGKKYVSDVINESGVRLLLTIIPSKYKKQVLDWITGMLDPIDEQSKRKAHQLYKTNLISEDEVGKTISLQKIHAYIFEGLYDFAGKIRTKTISKGGFIFANGDFLPQTLLPTRIWLDLIFIKELKECIDWSKIDKKDYFDAMMSSPNSDVKIKELLKDALTDEIDNSELFLKGIDTSYNYEEVE